MRRIPPNLSISCRLLRIRLKDKHAKVLRERAFWVNQVWNFCNAHSIKVLERERRFVNESELQAYTKGATKCGLPLHSQSVQAICDEYVTRRRQFKKAKLRWRVSKGSRRSLGWIPFKKSAIQYRDGQLWMSGIDKPMGLWDSYGLKDYELGAGNISEDARGRWYINLTVKVKKIEASVGRSPVGIDLGLKDFMATSEGWTEDALRFYRDLEPKLAVAQRTGNKGRARAIHAKIANRRKDHLHKLSTALVQLHGAIFVGNVNASGLAQTNMAKSVLDAGWSMFRTMLQYKSDRAGVWFQEIDEAYSTQTCCACSARTGPRGLESLGIREWTCLCGVTHQRDSRGWNRPSCRRNRHPLGVA